MLILTLFLAVTVKWLAVKTASEMIYTVSGGALNSAQSILADFDRNWHNHVNYVLWMLIEELSQNMKFSH